MSTYHVPIGKPHHFFSGPSTNLGRRALRWLGWGFALFVVVVSVNMVYEAVVGGGQPHSGFVYDTANAVSLLAFVASAGFALASGVGAVVAIVRRGERSWAVFATLLPALLILLIFLHPLFLND